MRPMLATKGDHVPSGGEWLHEVKWDGMRVLADSSVAGGGGVAGVRLTSRNENDVTVSWPELHPLGDLLAGRGALLDGEVVGFIDGRPDFGALADRIHVGKLSRAQALSEVTPATYLIFDLLRLDGDDLTSRPLTERRERLEELGLVAERWQVPAAYDDGDMLLQATEQQGLEGIVAKRRSSRYEAGARSRHWRKFAHRRRTSWVVGGWRPETGSQSRLGALLVGEPTADGLIYRGRVGSGIAGKAGPLLLELLAGHSRASSPFADEVPRLDALGTSWVEPLLVVDVESLGMTPQRRLRQPAYRGVRVDLQPADLIGGGS